MYADRPRDAWRTEGGALKMDTLPLDTAGLLDLRSEEAPSRLPPETRLGHVHLSVSDLQRSILFYERVLGFDLITRFGTAAGFLAAGGYHHHIGLNTWRSRGAPPSPEGAAGLRSFSLRLLDEGALQALISRLAAVGVEVDRQEGRVSFRGPDGLRIVVLSDSAGEVNAPDG